MSEKNNITIEKSKSFLEGKLYRPKKKILVFIYSHLEHSFENVQKNYNEKGEYVNSLLTEIGINRQPTYSIIDDSQNMFVEMIDGVPAKVAGKCGDLKEWELM